MGNLQTLKLEYEEYLRNQRVARDQSIIAGDLPIVSLRSGSKARIAISPKLRRRTSRGSCSI